MGPASRRPATQQVVPECPHYGQQLEDVRWVIPLRRRQLSSLVHYRVLQALIIRMIRLNQDHMLCSML